MTVQDTDGLRRVEEKIDKLIEGLPRTYTSQAESDRRFTALEAIIKTIQSHIDLWADINRQDRMWDVGEHQAIREAIGNTEQRILNRIDDEAKTRTSNRLVIWLCIGGWFISLILFALNTLISHWH